MKNDEIKRAEEMFKKGLFDKLGELIDVEFENIQLTKQLAGYEGINEEIPRIRVTINNKIVELQHEFERVGLSLYVKETEKYGVIPSFVGNAIVMDLIDMGCEASEVLSKCSNKQQEILEKRIRGLSMKKVSPFRRFVNRIRGVFKPVNRVDSAYKQEDIEELKSLLSKYRELNNRAWKYNLRENIVSSIAKEIRRNEFQAFMVPELVEEDVVPEFKQLGIIDLVPQLQQRIVEEYKKDLPNPDIHKIEDRLLHVYVPDFEKERERIKNTSADDFRRLAEIAKLEEDTKKMRVNN